jgi:hypothetical protein
MSVGGHQSDGRSEAELIEDLDVTECPLCLDERRDQEFFLRLLVHVGSSGRHPGLLGDPAHARSVYASLGH